VRSVYFVPDGVEVRGYDTQVPQWIGMCCGRFQLDGLHGLACVAGVSSWMGFVGQIRNSHRSGVCQRGQLDVQVRYYGPQIGGRFGSRADVRRITIPYAAHFWRLNSPMLEDGRANSEPNGRAFFGTRTLDLQ
jgi:hypothetical protein